MYSAETSGWYHNDVIMSAMASQITGVSVVYLTVFFRCRSNKTSKLRVTGLCEGNSPVTGEFPAQRVSNAEDESFWWRHHVYTFSFHKQPSNPEHQEIGRDAHIGRSAAGFPKWWRHKATISSWHAQSRVYWTSEPRCGKATLERICQHFDEIFVKVIAIVVSVKYFNNSNIGHFGDNSLKQIFLNKNVMILKKISLE